MTDRETLKQYCKDLESIGLMEVDRRCWVSNSYQFRKLDWRDLDELKEVEKVQDLVWGFGSANVIPTHLLGVIEETGGDLIGACDDKMEMRGFCLSLSTSDPGKRFVHMVGVVEERQSTGLGKELLLLEGMLARANGVKKIEWTYDPLMGANSQLYVAKLGARPFKYTINKYGVVENKDTRGESRYKNVETDRLTVRWEVGVAKDWERAVKGLGPRVNLEAIESWDGYGKKPVTFKMIVPYDFTRLTTDEMMDARMAIRRMAVRTMEVEELNNRIHRSGSHEVTAFVKGNAEAGNCYILDRIV